MLTFARISSIAAVFPLIAIAGSLQISGPYANRFSQADVQQVTALVSKEPKLDHRLKQIEAVGPDKVHIQTGGRTAVDSATYFDCDAYKRGGRWVIDTNSIEISIETIENRNPASSIMR